LSFLFFSVFLDYYAGHAIAAAIVIKIKIILVLLFIGGSIFYGLKVWQGKALGCPEPVIQVTFF
jgi:hypothetical protein